jgi:hypothetical protein
MKLPATQTQRVDVDVNPKDIINAAVGSAYFRMYNPDTAMAITLTGQAAIQRLEIAFNDRLGEITGEYTGDLEYKSRREATEEEEKWREKFLNELINCVKET